MLNTDKKRTDQVMAIPLLTKGKEFEAVSTEAVHLML